MSTLKLKSKFNPIVQILNGNEKHQKANIKLLSDAITKGLNQNGIVFFTLMMVDYPTNKSLEESNLMKFKMI